MPLDPTLAAWMTQSITLAPYTSHNNYGEPAWGAGVQYKARVESKIKLVRAMDGQQVVSTETVYLATVPATLTQKDKLTLPDGRIVPILATEKVPDEYGNPYYVAIYTGVGPSGGG